MAAIENRLGALYLPAARSGSGVCGARGAGEDVHDPRRPNSCAVHGGRLTQRLAAWREGLELFNVCPGLFRMWNNAASLSQSGPRRAPRAVRVRTAGALSRGKCSRDGHTPSVTVLIF